MDNRERSVTMAVIDLLRELHKHGEKPISEHHATPTGVDPIEWHIRFGPLVRTAITNLESITYK
jgi:hypothetical protein